MDSTAISIVGVNLTKSVWVGGGGGEFPILVMIKIMQVPSKAEKNCTLP